MKIPKSFLGYKRENGRAGTRNHVIILPVDDISNACAEAVANNIKGIKPMVKIPYLKPELNQPSLISPVPIIILICSPNLVIDHKKKIKNTA